MLITWMADNQFNKWSEGMRVVQFITNRIHHFGIKRCPCEAMTGCQAKVGLCSSIILQNILQSINYEADLEKLEDFQETVIIGSRTNFTQDDIM